MSTGLKLLLTAGVFGAGILTFAVGVVFLGGTASDAPADTPPPAVAEAPPPLPTAPTPAAEGPRPAAPAPTPAQDTPAGPPKPATTPAPGGRLIVAPDQGWTVNTIFGLPAPRKLYGKEKAALHRLGTTSDVHTYKFNRITLADGSTIPGTPLPTEKEVKEQVVTAVKRQGLADGFETAVLALAPRGLYHLTVQVSEAPEWSAVEPPLGKPDGKSEADLWLEAPQSKGRTHLRVAWMRYGWLEFGVGQGKVRAVRADMSHADLVEAHTVPGGRSAPDPSKAATTKKPKPHRSPTEPAAEVDALKLLGHALDAGVTTRKSPVRDPKLDELTRRAPSLAGKDLYPDAIEFARQLKRSVRSEFLVITPSKNPTIEEVTDLLGDPTRTEADATTVPGQRLTWHRYFWLDFGTVGGKVVKVRLNCLMTPVGGL